MAKFVVVKFLEENQESFSAVSDQWLHKLNDKDSCRFPCEDDFSGRRRPSLKELAIAHADSSRWSSYTCKIYSKKFGKFLD